MSRPLQTTGDLPQPHYVQYFLAWLANITTHVEAITSSASREFLGLLNSGVLQDLTPHLISSPPLQDERLPDIVLQLAVFAPTPFPSARRSYPRWDPDADMNGPIGLEPGKVGVQ
jgi:hypothetical protein